MNNLSVKFSIVLAILFVTCFSIWSQTPLQDFEKAWIEQENQDLRKAITEESMPEIDRIVLVKKNAVKLKEYGLPKAFPKGDIPLKTNREGNYRLAMARSIYTNDLRGVFKNQIMTEQLRMINSLQIEIAEEQIKFLIPGNGTFELSKEVVEKVFDWNIVNGVHGEKNADTKDLVKKFNNLASSKKFLDELNRLYAEEKELLNKLYGELKEAEALQSKLREVYDVTYNSTFTHEKFKHPGSTSTNSSSPASTSSSAENFIKANIPFGWKVDTNKPSNWVASSKRKIIEKSGQCHESFLDINVVATISPLSGTMATTEIDKKLRSWMSESGWYPVEASIEAISINGFKGRLLTSTLKYNDGIGSPMAGYRDGKAHIFGHAMLIADDGSKMLKVRYSSFAGSCWDNKSSSISKKEALAGKNEAEQVIRSITISGMNNSTPVSLAYIYTPENDATPTVSTVYTNPKNLNDEKLREVLLLALTNEPATKDEIKYWTEREKQIKKSPVKPQPKGEPTTETKPKAKTKSSTEMIVGDWKLIANGFSGILEIRFDGSALQGRVFFNSIGKWEPLQDLQFDSSTGKFTFLRPNAKQQHEGVLNGTTLNGTFTGNYKWSATKTSQPQSQSQTNNEPPTITTTSPTKASWADALVGDWNIISNGFSGKFEIRYDGSKLQGRIFYNTIGRWESLENIQFNAASGQISFYRPIPKQPFEGTLNGSNITGTFSDKYKWSATKTVGASR